MQGATRLVPIQLLRSRFRQQVSLGVTLYEANFYQRRHAEAAGDHERTRFLREVENFLTGRILRNPRLLYYWSPEGGGLFALYELATREHYTNNVLLNPTSPLQYEPDLHGPFSSIQPGQ